MTDKEIIKALECHTSQGCAACPYDKGLLEPCIGQVMKDTLDFINRQQAEIDRCHKEFEELNIIEEEERKEALENARKHSVLFKSMVDYAIAEAIKQFVNDLKCAINPFADYEGEDVWKIAVEIAEEMVGADNET